VRRYPRPPEEFLELPHDPALLEVRVHLERVTAVDAALALHGKLAGLRLVALVMAAMRTLHEEHEQEKKNKPI